MPLYANTIPEFTRIELDVDPTKDIRVSHTRQIMVSQVLPDTKVPIYSGYDRSMPICVAGGRIEVKTYDVPSFVAIEEGQGNVQPIVLTADNGVLPGRQVCATGGVPSTYSLDGDNIILDGDTMLDYIYQLYINGVLVPDSLFIGCTTLPDTVQPGDRIRVSDLSGNVSNELLVDDWTPALTGSGRPNSVVTSDFPGQFAINGVNVGGPLARTVTIPWSIRPGDSITQRNSAPFLVPGMRMWAEGDQWMVYGVSAPTFSRASTATRYNASRVLESVAANQLRIDYDPATGGRLGYLGESQKVNKCTNFNANPTDLTNVSKAGDSASTLTVVDDTAALAAAGLSAICSSGRVYKLDNSLGVGSARVVVAGSMSVDTLHSASAYIRGGSGHIGYGNISADATVPFEAEANYRRIKRDGSTASAGRSLVILANAGQVVYFILNQLEEGGLSSPIPTTGAQATRQADSMVISDMGWFDPAGGVFRAKVRAYPGSVTSGNSDLFYVGPQNNNRVGIRLRSTNDPYPRGLVGSGTSLPSGNAGTNPPSQTDWERLVLSYSTANGSFFGRKTGNANAVISENIGNSSGVMPANMTLAEALNGTVDYIDYFPVIFSSADNLSLVNAMP